MFGSFSPRVPAKLALWLPISLVTLAAFTLPAPLESAAQEAGVPVNGVVSRAGEADLSFRVTTNTTARGFDVVLTAPPTTPVTMLITSDDPGAAVALVSSIEFDAANWNVPQTVRVRSVIDADANDEEVTFTLTNTANGQSVTRVVRIKDSISGALLVNPTAVQSLAAGESVEYATRLELAPTADVVVEVTASDPSVFESQTLIFTPENWDQAQTSIVTLPAAATSSAGTMDELTLTFAVDTSVSAPEYGGLEAIRTVELTETEMNEIDEPEESEPATPETEEQTPAVDPATPIDPTDPLDPELPTSETDNEELEGQNPEGGFGGAAPEEDSTNNPGEDLGDPEVITPIGNEPETSEPGDVVEGDTGFGGAAPETDDSSGAEVSSSTPVGAAGPGGLIRTGGYSR